MSEDIVQNGDLEVEELAGQGLTDMAIGDAELRTARDWSTESTVAAAAGASDLTRAVDAEVVADRLAALSEVVGEASIDDILEGEDLLDAADDVDVMSAIVGLMSLGDAERGLAVGRVAGELATLAEVADGLEMPVLALILDSRGEQLKSIAVDVMLHAAAERGLSQLMAATSKRVGEIGANEIDEGLIRAAASDFAAERSAELAEASAGLAVRGAVEMAAAGAAAEIADDMEADGIADTAIGAAELGAAAVMDEED